MKVRRPFALPAAPLLPVQVALMPPRASDMSSGTSGIAHRPPRRFDRLVVVMLVVMGNRDELHQACRLRASRVETETGHYGLTRLVGLP